MGKVTHTFDLHHFRPRAEMDQNPSAKITAPASPMSNELQPIAAEVHSAGEGSIQPPGFKAYEQGANPLESQSTFF